MQAQKYLSNLCIAVGTRCNFRCRHCLLDSKKKDLNLTNKEISLLQSTIRKYVPKVVSFTGGEPTLYLTDINKIISAHPIPNKLKVTLATNGSFATSQHDAMIILSSIPYLRHIQLSYDRFHSEFLPIQNVYNLYNACNEMGISFSITSVIQSPLDIVQVRELKKIGNFKIRIQLLCDIGEARKKALVFDYPVFDKSVFNKFCPGRNQISYLCGKGFSICCGNLLFNDAYPQVIHKTVDEHLDSNFYKMMTSYNFGDLLKIFWVSKGNLLPRHSGECALCEYIFKHVKQIPQIKQEKGHV